MLSPGPVELLDWHVQSDWCARWRRSGFYIQRLVGIFRFVCECEIGLFLFFFFFSFDFFFIAECFFFSPLFQMKSVYSRALHRIRCGSNLPSLPLIYSNVYKHRCRTIIHRATRPTMSTTTNVTMWKMHIFTVTDSKNGCKIFSTGRTKGTIFTLMMLCGTGSDNGSATHANNRTISSNLWCFWWMKNENIKYCLIFDKMLGVN